MGVTAATRKQRTLRVLLSTVVALGAFSVDRGAIAQLPPLPPPPPSVNPVCISGCASGNSPTAPPQPSFQYDAATARRTLLIREYDQQLVAAWNRSDWQEVLRISLLRQKLRDGPNVRAYVNWARGEIAWAAGDHHKGLAYFQQAIQTWPQYSNVVRELEHQVAAEDQAALEAIWAAQEANSRAAAGQQAAGQVAAFRAELNQKIATIQPGQSDAIASADDRVRAYLAENTANAIPKKPVLVSGIISPSMFVTQAQYESAFREIVRLQTLRDNLTAKIAEVQRWRTGLRRDEKEFETMRVEAQEDLGWEFVDHVPVSEALDALKGIPALKRLNVEKIKAAYGAAKSLLETGRGLSAEDDHEKAQMILDGNRALRDAMIDAAGLNEKDKALLDAVSKITSYGADAAIAASAHNVSDREKLKTVMKLVEALQPWWGLGALGENLAERGVQYYEAGVALDSLHDARSSNWNAQRYLTDKLNRVNDEIKEEQLIVEKYKMPDGRDRQ